MRHTICRRCGTRVDLKANQGGCPNCGCALARLMERRWTRRGRWFFLVAALGFVAWFFLPPELMQVAVDVMLVGRAGIIVSFLRMLTYGRSYDPTYGIVD
jgi:ribosomal protein L37E